MAEGREGGGLGEIGAALGLWLVAGCAVAGDVISARPDTVEVTVYRDRAMSVAEMRGLGDGDAHGLALVVETRDVVLPAGRSRLRFEGVADGIIPQSAGEEGLPAAIVERDFDYDLISPASLVARSVGRTVQVVRTNPRTGRETSESAVIRSGPEGVVLQTGGHFEALRCGGEAERLVFDGVPSDLAAAPTLSLAVNAPSAGRYRVRLSYLTVRVDWAAAYVAQVAPDGRSLALSGWITLANRGDTGFENAPTAVVAGHLARAPVEIPAAATPALEKACWPEETTHSGWPAALRLRAPAPAAMLGAPRAAMFAEASVAVRKQAIESQLGDYKLYTLAEPTTVAARQTKQVLFLDQPAVKFETVYAHTVRVSDESVADPTPTAADTVLRLRNTNADGLGRPLPAGSVQLRRPQAMEGGRELLVGEPELDRDVPVGEPFELRVGQASAVTLTDRATSEQRRGGRISRSYEVLAANAKTLPVVVEVRHDRAGASGFAVITESARHGDKAGDPVWRLSLAPGERRTLRYTVEYARQDLRRE